MINELVKKYTKKSLMLLVVFCVLACNRNEERTYYFSGNLESVNYYNKNSLVKTVVLYDSVLKLKYKEIHYKKGYDSVVYYYKNGIIHKTGNMTKGGDYLGKWHSYTKEGLLSETNEYMIVKGEVILNQVWFFNKKERLK